MKLFSQLWVSSFIYLDLDVDDPLLIPYDVTNHTPSCILADPSDNACLDWGTKTHVRYLNTGVSMELRLLIIKVRFIMIKAAILLIAWSLSPLGGTVCADSSPRLAWVACYGW